MKDRAASEARKCLSRIISRFFFNRLGVGLSKYERAKARAAQDNRKPQIILDPGAKDPALKVIKFTSPIVTFKTLLDPVAVSTGSKAKF
jgi:hypothetical protein